jgi:hypothetical protein
MKVRNPDVLNASCLELGEKDINKNKRNIRVNG